MDTSAPFQNSAFKFSVASVSAKISDCHSSTSVADGPHVSAHDVSMEAALIWLIKNILHGIQSHLAHQTSYTNSLHMENSYMNSSKYRNAVWWQINVSLLSIAICVEHCLLLSCVQWCTSWWTYAWLELSWTVYKLYTIHNLGGSRKHAESFFFLWKFMLQQGIQE